jgi:hypothetical protein
MPYINQNSSNPMQGMIRVNGSMLQVFDGSSWISMSSSNSTISLSGTAESAIQWALKKMAEEEEFKQLAKTNEAVAGAMADVELAKEKLKVVAILAQDQNAKV